VKADQALFMADHDSSSAREMPCITHACGSALEKGCGHPLTMASLAQASPLKGDASAPTRRFQADPTEKEAETAPSLFFRRVLGALGRRLLGALRLTESL
jgi:hypothetical protein